MSTYEIETATPAGNWYVKFRSTDEVQARQHYKYYTTKFRGQNGRLIEVTEIRVIQEET